MNANRFSLLLIAWLVGCRANPCFESAMVDQARTSLVHQLKRRDTEIVDLAAVGKTLVEYNGAFNTQRAVHEVWFVLTSGEPPSKAHDVSWLLDQPARVRDVAWLIQFEKEWNTDKTVNERE